MSDEIVKPKRKQGFACMDKDKQRAVASKGGKRAHELGKAHTFSREEASRAGKIGGQATAAKGSGYLSEIGRKGGKALRRKRRQAIESITYIADTESNSSIDEEKPTE